jgi:hypothetical protein
MPPVIPTIALFQFASRVVSEDDVEDGDVLVPVTGLGKTFAKLAAACILHIVDASPEVAAKVEAEGGWKIRIRPENRQKAGPQPPQAARLLHQLWLRKIEYL